MISLSSDHIEEPVVSYQTETPSIIYREVSPKKVVSRDVSNETVTTQITAYTWTGNKTSSGTWPEEGRTIAACLNTFPMGTLLWIEGVGYRTVEDTIPPESIAKGARLDLYMDCKEEVRQWGRRDVRVTIMGDD